MDYEELPAAEAQLADLEASFLAAKADGTVTREQKAELREARRRVRLRRHGIDPDDPNAE